MKQYLYNKKPYLIAETAYSFEGDKEYLLKQTTSLSQKVSAIKYHILLNIDEYMLPSHSVYNHAKSWMLPIKDWIEILSVAKENKLDTVILADDIDSIRLCEDNSDLVDAIEIHAACVNDLELLDRATQFAIDYEKVFIIGISGFELQELLDISEYLKAKKLKDVIMMYGFQNYPTNINDIKLSRIPILREILGFNIGYADHTFFGDNYKETIINTSFCLGANFQEVHYVLEEGVERTDYSAAIGLERIENINKILQTSFYSIGDPDFRLSLAEKQYLNFRKVPIANKEIKKDSTLKKEDVSYKRVEFPIKQHKFREIEDRFGKKLLCDINENDEIIDSKFSLI